MKREAVRTLSALILGLALASGLAACGDDEPSGPQNPATIRVQNDFGGSVLRLFLKGCGTVSWGSDRLGSQETIAPGASRDFTVEAGCWDVGADVFTKPFDQDPTQDDLMRKEVFGTNVAEGDVETVVLMGEPEQN